MTNYDEMTQKLNQSGAFLQVHVLNELKKRNWDTEIETPRIVAPFIQNPVKLRDLLNRGDSNRINADEFPHAVSLSQDHVNKEELSLDIYAGNKKQFGFLRLVIEVKKKNPDYVDWCFLQLEKKKEPMRVINKSINAAHGYPTLFHVGETTRYGNELFVQIDQFPQWTYLKKEVSDFAIALKEKKVGKEYYKSEKTEIDRSVIQILKGLYGTINEHVIHQVVSGKGYDNLPDIYIPIIVTNANLFLVDFDPNDINDETGQISKNPNYISVNSIIYEYPTPKTIQYPEPLNAQLNEISRLRLLKSQVLIMNTKGFSEFLSEIESIPDVNMK